MFRGTFIQRWRSMLTGSIACAALVVAGCAQQEQPDQSDWYTTSGNAPAARAAASGNQGQNAQAANAQAQNANSTASMAFPTGNRNTSDLLVEQIGPREVRVNQPYNYQLRVTNLSDKPLTGVVLRQKISDNFKLASNESSPEASDQNGQGTISVGDLGPRQSKTIGVSGTPTAPGTLDTCVSAKYNPPTLCSKVAIVAPQIKAVAEGPSQADVCQDLVYRYTVTNTGTGTAHNVVLQEELPQGLQTTDGRQNLSMNVGDLAQGQSKSVEGHVKATQAGRFTTRAIVKSDAGEAQTDQVATSVLAPRLAVTVSAPREMLPDQPISYRVDVKNVGDAPAMHTRLRVGATPGKVDFVNAQGGEGAQLASEQQRGGQDLGTIAPGESRTVTINFKPREGGANSFDATATADCAQPVTTPANSNLRTVTASALVVTHDPDPVPVGSNVTYHVTVTNKGSVTDHDIKVSATLPDGLQFIRGSGKTDVTNNGQDITFGTIPALAPRQSISWDVQAKALQPGQVEFKANMTSQSTPNAAAKVEPTKLIGGATGTQTHTNVAPQQQGQGNPPQQEQQQQQQP